MGDLLDGETKNNIRWIRTLLYIILILIGLGDFYLWVLISR